MPEIYIILYPMRKAITSPYEQLIKIFGKYAGGTAGDYDEVDLLAGIVEVFRPAKGKRPATVDISPLLQLLSSRADLSTFFKAYLQQLLHRKDFVHIISDAGIINYADFLYEIRKRTVQKILPYQPPKDTLQYILNQVFYATRDPEWLSCIPQEQLEKLFILCECRSLYSEDKLSYELNRLLYSLEVLTQRISGRALESDVSKMVPEYENFDSPFIGLLREMSELLEKIKNDTPKYVSAKDITYKQVWILHQQCEDFIETAFANSHKFGISIKVNQSLLRLRQQLERIKEVLPLLVLEDAADAGHQTIAFGMQLIRYNCNKTNVRKLVSEGTQQLSYEITQHTAETGEHYITTSVSEYWKMLWSACGGGLIVAFLCIFKVLLGKVETSGLGHAFLYSMNYAAGFIAIYLFGCTLATKQPAMTAAALVRALQKDTGDKVQAEHKYWNFAVFFARVFRSQFIAFVGNVLMAFPVALLLIWGIDKISGYNIAAAKWYTLVHDLDPVDSPAIFHAAIAGFFLFVSGIIAGSIANRDKHNAVYYRIRQHPILKKVFGKERTGKIAGMYEKKWAGIISNFWFGVFMGSTASIGLFIGLDLDIRHITFASGNLALGIYGGSFDIPSVMILWGVLGIGIIGLVNFTVSFSLSLALAFRSRNMSVLELKLVAMAVWEFFKLKPMHFFFPPREKVK